MAICWGGSQTSETRYILKKKNNAIHNLYVVARGGRQRNNQQLMRYATGKPALMGGEERPRRKVCAVLMATIATARDR